MGDRALAATVAAQMNVFIVVCVKTSEIPFEASCIISGTYEPKHHYYSARNAARLGGWGRGTRGARGARGGGARDPTECAVT